MLRLYFEDALRYSSSRTGLYVQVTKEEPNWFPSFESQICDHRRSLLLEKNIIVALYLLLLAAYIISVNAMSATMVYYTTHVYSHRKYDAKKSFSFGVKVFSVLGEWNDDSILTPFASLIYISLWKSLDSVARQACSLVHGFQFSSLLFAWKASFSSGSKTNRFLSAWRRESRFGSQCTGGVSQIWSIRRSSETNSLDFPIQLQLNKLNCIIICYIHSSSAFCARSWVWVPSRTNILWWNVCSLSKCYKI